MIWSLSGVPLRTVSDIRGISSPCAGWEACDDDDDDNVCLARCCLKADSLTRLVCAGNPALECLKSIGVGGLPKVLEERSVMSRTKSRLSREEETRELGAPF